MLFGRKTLEALGTSEDRALSISEDVRHRDEERLAIQAVEGLLGGPGKTAYPAGLAGAAGQTQARIRTSRQTRSKTISQPV
jgi:hypothetical protein